MLNIGRIRSLAVGLLISAVTLLIVFALIEGFIALIWNPLPQRLDSRTLEGMNTGGAIEWTRFAPNTEAMAVSPTAEFEVRYSINSLGLRDRERSIKGDDGVPRVLVLGDSFAEGYGVEARESFPRVAEDQWPEHWEWLNGGRRGLSPSKAYYRLQSLLDRGLEIDIVLLQVHDNDFDDDRLYQENLGIYSEPSGRLIRQNATKAEQLLHNAGSLGWKLSNTHLYRLLHQRSFPSKSNPHSIRCGKIAAHGIVSLYQANGISGVKASRLGKRTWLVEFQGLPERILPPDALRELWALLKHQKLNLANRKVRRALVALSQKGRAHDSFAPEGEIPENALLTYEYLDTLQHLVKSLDIPLLVYYQPRANRLAISGEETWFRLWCQSNGVPFLSLREELALAVLDSPDPLYYPIDGHLTSLGHYWVGTRLAAWASVEIPKAITTGEP